jgi:hypothetical protein
MVEIDPRFHEDFRQLMARNGVGEPSGLMTLPAYAKEEGYEVRPLFATVSEVAFLRDLPVPEQNRVLIRAAAAHLRDVLDYAKEFFPPGQADYFCAVTIEFWEEFDAGGIVQPRFLFANPAREFLQNISLLPGTSPYSEFSAECLDHSEDYALNDQYDPFVMRRGLPESLDRVRFHAVWLQHISCQVPEYVVLPDPRP